MRFDNSRLNSSRRSPNAQSLAVGNDNPYIEPQHGCMPLLKGRHGTVSLLQRAGGM